MFSAQRARVKNFSVPVSIASRQIVVFRGTYQSRYHKVVIDLPFQFPNPPSDESQDHGHGGNNNERYANVFDQRTTIFVLVSELVE